MTGRRGAFFAPTDAAEDYAAARIEGICGNPIFKTGVIRVMPDVRPGKWHGQIERALLSGGAMGAFEQRRGRGWTCRFPARM